MKTNLALRGLWTPWADVVCLKCHGPSFGSFREPMPPGEFAERSVEWIEGEPGQVPTVCDKCRALIWVRSDVALLNNLRLAIGETSWEDDSWGGSSMMQMGGMCCGLRVQTRKPGVIAVVTDGEAPGPDSFMLGLYTEAGWDSGDEEAATLGWGVYRGTRNIMAAIRAARITKRGLLP